MTTKDELHHKVNLSPRIHRVVFKANLSSVQKIQLERSKRAQAIFNQTQLVAVNTCELLVLSSHFVRLLCSGFLHACYLSNVV